MGETTFFFVDESGDQNFLGRRKTDLITTGKASRYFIVGHIELTDHGELSREFSRIREEIAGDDYLREIPSIRSSLKCFHANKDCREVQERVFRVLRNTEFKGFAVVIEKKLDEFISRFKGKKGNLYSYMVERLFENRLHEHEEIHIYFSKVRNVIHERSMWEAIERAKARFMARWKQENHGSIRIFMQNPSQLAGLQAVDYFLWAVHRVYNNKEFRYYNYLQDRVSLIHDLSWGKEYYGTYFSKRNPLTRERFADDEKGPSGG